MLQTKSISRVRLKMFCNNYEYIFFRIVPTHRKKSRKTRPQINIKTQQKHEKSVENKHCFKSIGYNNCCKY